MNGQKAKTLSDLFVNMPCFSAYLKRVLNFKHADESDGIDAILSNHPEIKEAYSVLDRYQRL